MNKKSKKSKKSEEPKEPDSLQIRTSQNSNIISWIVFFFTISIVLLSLVSVVFPAMIGSSVTEKIPGIEIERPDPFELGVWAVPLIITDTIFFGFAILYFKKKLPKQLSNGFSFLFNFEISKKVSIIVVAIIIIGYIAATAGELGVEETWSDYKSVKERAQTWNLESIPTSTEPHVKYFLITTSMQLFGNYKIIPFIASIALLITTFLITNQITKKRFAGIISLIILLQSNLFLTYDTSVAYDNFWILFYLLSLYFIYKVWPLSPVSYLFALPSKALTVLFLPMSLFFIFRSNINRKRKIIISIVMVAIILILVSVVSSRGISFGLAGGEQTEFDSNDFWVGFTSMAPQLRFDGIVLMFLLPLVVGLFLSSRRGMLQADSVMVLIMGMLLIPAILAGFSDQTNQPYRFVPLIVFFAVGVGTILSKFNEKV